jgi:type IV pilus assembly protein PilY1
LLHAFKLGQLVLSWSGQGVYQKAKLVNPDTSTPIGYEQWAFIPKNALPYLPYTADPNYCHSYSVDLTPVILDASIGAPGSGDVSASLKTTGNRDCSTPGTCDWRTILIGGMRWGGACRKTGTACNSGQCSVTTGTSCTTNSNCPSGETCVPNCVNTPITDPSDSTKGLGYSSYFALDVTDQSNPSLLWEYSSDNLGFATTGPAIVRVGDKATNGKWFAVFGSGPTGPMDTTNFQFLGRSDQPLKFFVVDLKTGALAATIDPGIPTAFSGSLYNASVDTDYDYQDDAVYAGYVKKSGSTWTDGGIGTIVTKHDPNPAHWTWRRDPLVILRHRQVLL